VVNEQQSLLTKNISATFLLGLMAQTIALIWFVATLRTDVDANSLSITRLEVQTDNIEEVVNIHNVTLGRMDENIKGIRISLDKMLDRGM